jgi:hypothetical protein
MLSPTKILRSSSPGFAIFEARDVSVLDIAAELDPLPIDTAPIEPGKEFGPCLSWQYEAANFPEDTCWVIGWDGEEWWDQDFTKCHPTLWRPLPAPGPQTRKIDERIAEYQRRKEEGAALDAMYQAQA